MAIATVNPATGETVKTFDEMDEADVERCLATAAAAYARYRLTSFAERAGWMQNAAAILDAEQDQIAAMMTTEMGKTLAAAKAEVAKCATTCRYYAENAERFLADEPADAGAVGARNAYVSYQPIGPVLAVMPWNFPLWQAMRFAAPALMAGNVGLLKHASNVPQTALFMQDLFARAGFPIGTFQTLLVGSARVEAILRDRRVVAATLTGSNPAGSRGGGHRRERDQEGRARTGRQRPVRRHAVGRPAPGRRGRRDRAVAEQRPVLHRGQALHRPRRRSTTSSSACSPRRCRARPSATRWRRAPTSGRWPPKQQRDDVEHLVADAVANGARALCGGAAPEGPGFYYPPTVLTGITPEMRVHTEEVFGPVATLYRVPDLDAAIELANATEFGLGANAWTNDEDERARFVRDLDAGHGLRQRQRDLLPAAAVRRRQELRVRPGALRPGHPRVLQRQDGVGRRRLASLVLAPG